MTEPERDRFFGEVFDALNAAAEVLPEGRPHRRAQSSALDALTLHFKTTGRQIYVADELTVIAIRSSARGSGALPRKC